MSTMQTVMMTMFEHAKLSLDDQAIEEVAKLTEAAADEARRLSGLCEGLGCLVAGDGRDGGVGSFQDADSVSSLLFSMAHSFDTIAAMANVGGEAWYELNQRRTAKTEGAQA
jgi:hypothetical protein